MTSFGFDFSSPEEMIGKIRSSSQERGLPSTGNEMTNFWLLSMDMLRSELKEAAQRLVVSFGNNPQTQNQQDLNNLNKKIEVFEDAISKISWTDNDITLSPTEFYNKFFAHCVNIKDVAGPNGSWRDLFEHIGASNQCKAAMNKLNEVIDWDLCYICGLKIEDTGGQHDTRECEHILPAFTALGYKGLIQSSKLNLAEYEHDPTILEFFRYEYANAHRCCNQIKSDDKWIKYEDGVYSIDKGMLRYTLTNIYKSTSYDCPSLRLKGIGKINEFIKYRGEYITTKFLNPILNIIMKAKLEYGDLFDLSIRIKQVKALKENVASFANAILGRTPLLKIPVKQIDYKNAVLLARKQFRDPLELFYDVFKDIFSRSNLLYVEILWSTYINEEFGGRIQLRGLQRMARKVFESPNIQSMQFKDQVLNENIEHLKSIYTSTLIEEDKIISLNNIYFLKIKEYYRNKIYELAFYTLTKYNVQIPEEYKEQILQSMIFSGRLDQSEDAETKQEQVNILNDMQQFGGKVNQKSGNGKKNMVYNYMKGGDDDLIESYKHDILELASELGFNPENYGIGVTTLRSGRVSIPPLPLTYGPGYRQGVQIGDTFFFVSDDKRQISDGTNVYNIEHVFGEGYGIRDSEGNFYKIGGKKEHAKKYKINKTKYRFNKSRINKNKTNKAGKTRKSK